MKRFLIALLLAAVTLTPASADPAAPLVVGSVRDQTGDPVSGAKVVLWGPNGAVEGSTDPDGTFAVQAPGAVAATVSCAYCRALHLAIAPGEPVVAIVRRYRALLQDVPSAADLIALPYGHVESALSLTPFVVLADTRSIFPGPQVSDRGLSRAGGLVIDNGVPNYDIAANASPFSGVPDFSIGSVAVSDARAAFRYGDRADAGTFIITPPSGPTSFAAGAGSDGFAGVHLQGPFAAFNGAVSGNAIEHRSRVDVQSAQPIAEGSVSETISLAQGVLAPFPNDRLSQSFDAARISAQSVRALRRYADVTTDHGTYELQLPATWVGSQWSDAGVRVGIESLGNANAFVEAGVRRSNGYYDSSGRIPAIAAGVDQFSLTTGLRSDFEKTSAHFALAAYQIDYNGGPLEPEYASPANAAGTSLVLPSVDAQFRPNEHWQFDVVAGSTFRLPTLLERYGRPPARSLLAIDRNALVQTTLAFSDRARIRSALTAFRQNTTGFDAGSVSGVGASLAWQVAPRLALRSWMLRETDTTHAVVPLVRFTPARVAATVGSLWMTYETAGLRVDAIYRRDLMDSAGLSHFDFSISGNAASRVRWFAGSEVRHGARVTDAGLRF